MTNLVQRLVIAGANVTEAGGRIAVDEHNGSHVRLRDDLLVDAATPKAVLFREPEADPEEVDEPGTWIPLFTLVADEPHVWVAAWFAEGGDLDHLLQP